MSADKDSYSCFGDGVIVGKGTALKDELRQKGIDSLAVGGLALDV